jgi:hypothetical protein
MKIVKIAEGAYFVPSYSEQTITPAFDLSTTVQSLGPTVEEKELDMAPAIDVKPAALPSAAAR